MGMKQRFLEQHAPDWETDIGGTLICPHGNRCEDDQRNGLGDCGCVSPLVEHGMI
jgi:hypothetical protein